MKMQLSVFDIDAFRAFVRDDATQDPLANVDLEIRFSNTHGWRVTIDVYESTGHVTAEGEWCPTLGAAFNSAYQAF